MSWTIRGQAGYPTIDIVFMFVGRTVRYKECSVRDLGPRALPASISPTLSDPTAAAPRGDLRRSVVAGSGWPAQLRLRLSAGGKAVAAITTAIRTLSAESRVVVA